MQRFFQLIRTLNSVIDLIGFILVDAQPDAFITAHADSKGLRQ
jgi:hypothetical protein